MMVYPGEPMPATIPLMLLLGLNLGCTDKEIDPGDGSGDGGGGDGGTSGPECAEDTDCGDSEICEEDACVDGDRNNSVDEAERLLWEDTVSGVINPVDDVDYFVFTAEGGEWVRLRTTLTDPELGDTAITLRTAAGKVVTSSDNYPTGGSSSSADATVYAYLSQAGDYLVEVEDQGTYNGNGEELGDPDYAYTLELLTWNQVTEEPDGVGSPSIELEITGANSFYPVGVLLESEDDVDFVEITVGLSSSNFWMYGMLDLSGSDAEPAVRLWSEGEELLVQRSGLSEGGYAWYPYLPSGTYTLELYDRDLAGGDDHWFFLFPIVFELGDSYPFEAEPNDDLAGAQAFEMTTTTTSGGSTYGYGNATGHIDSFDDEDWFRVPARPGAELVVCLSAAIAGSLATPDIEVYDNSGALVGSGAGTASSLPNASVEDIVMGSGDYTIRVVDPDATHAGAGAWYRMVAYAADFEVGTYAEGGYSCPN